MARPGQRIESVTLYADKEQVQSAFDKITRAWKCIRCQQPFNLLQSMGQLECRQHPGYVQEDGRWSCCGKRQYGARWSRTWEMQRIYSTHTTDQFRMPYKPLPKVEGCQKCDHNTSDTPFTHRDAMPIADLSALLPAINKEFPFYLRKGFDDGVLRRCETRCIVVPPSASEVIYMDNSGQQKTYTPEEESIPEGIEISAVDEDGTNIKNWYA